VTTSEEIEGWRAGLDGLHARIASRFRRSEAPWQSSIRRGTRQEEGRTRLDGRQNPH